MISFILAVKLLLHIPKLLTAGYLNIENYFENNIRNSLQF